MERKPVWSASRAARGTLNRIAEFTDPSLEKEYLDGYIDASRKSLSAVLMLLAVVYALIMLLDMAQFPSETSVWLRLVNRMVPAAFALLASLVIVRGTSARTVMALTTMAALLFVFSYQAALSSHPETEYVAQSIPFILMLMVLFMAPTRWIYSLLTALLLCVEYALVMPLAEADPVAVRVWGVLMYQLVATGLAAAYNYSLNRYRRLQYIRGKELERLSMTDTLTGAYNRLMTDRMLKGQYAQWVDDGSFSVIMFDLDNFKQLNDTHGHLAGDEALVTVAQVVRESIRARDIFARWGGEEFLLICPDTDGDAARQLAERIRKLLEAAKLPHDFQVTASFGIATRREGDTPDSLLSRADSLMYEAKRAGKNRVMAA